MRSKQTLRQKDFDSFCLKYINEADKTGSSRFTPRKDFINVLTRVEELISSKFPQLQLSHKEGEIFIVKPISPTTPSPRKAQKPKLHPNTIFTPMRKS